MKEIVKKREGKVTRRRRIVYGKRKTFLRATLEEARRNIDDKTFLIIFFYIDLRIECYRSY